MSAVRLTVDGREVEAEPGETLFALARRLGTDLPHLCSGLNEGYEAAGNCRLCLVEVEGAKTLVAACVREVEDGMVVRTDTPRLTAARDGVMELLLADQPKRDESPDPQSRFWHLADAMGRRAGRFPASERPVADVSHAAIAVHLDACIHCTNCVRACRDEQVNDVIGLSFRGGRSLITFDEGVGLGDSSCVGCGECVQACPTGALFDKALVSKPVETRPVDSLCPYCGVGCQVTFHVADDAIVRVSGRQGPANEGRLCVKGRFGFDYARHPDRLTQPLIRREDAPKDAGLRFDPSDPFTHFRPATWDEALDRAAAGFLAIKAAKGPKALAGFGSAKGSNEEAYLFQKLVRTGFGSNNVDHCTRLCHASSVAALMEGVGSGAVTAPVAEVRHADVALLIGANPTVNHPVAASFIKNAVRHGLDLIVVDPRGQALGRHARHMLPIKPGADVALLNALMQVIVAEGLADESYLAAKASGVEDLRRHLEAFTPEAMADVCGIPAPTIREVARLFAGAERAMIFWGMGISQHVHGTENARALISLAVITGNVGRPGTGLHPLRGQNNVQGASDSGLIPMVLPDYRPVGDPSAKGLFEDFWGMDLDGQPGLTVVEVMNAVLKGDLEGLYVMGENPAMSDPNLHHARNALASLKHLVVQDIFLTETAALADVVLPASAFPEKGGTFTNTDRRVQLARPSLKTPGEARQDLDIIVQLANRLGLDWAYDGPRAVFDELRTIMRGFGGITWDRLEAEGCVTYPCDSADKPGRDVIFDDAFPTVDGRAKLVPARLIAPVEQADDVYPFVLTTGRLLEHWHTGSMTRRSDVLDDLEPGPLVFLAPRDAERLTLRPGDSVAVATRRGRVTAQARIDADMPPGLLFMPFCFADAPANLLTLDQLDPFGKIPEFKGCAARIERIGSG
ncbi:MAG: formate dehydrogenase subunit alpha [Rhodospirillales bacterium]